MGKRSRHLTGDRRALSPIFATMILIAMVISLGSFTYYYANTIVDTTTTEYAKEVRMTQDALSERLGFQHIYIDSGKLVIYVINCGNINDLKITNILVYKNEGNSRSLVASPHSVSMTPIDIGQEQIFNDLPFVLTSGTVYTFQLISERGSSFEKILKMP